MHMHMNRIVRPLPLALARYQRRKSPHVFIGSYTQQSVPGAVAADAWRSSVRTCIAAAKRPKRTAGDPGTSIRYLEGMAHYITISTDSNANLCSCAWPGQGLSAVTRTTPARLGHALANLTKHSTAATATLTSAPQGQRETPRLARKQPRQPKQPRQLAPQLPSVPAPQLPMLRTLLAAAAGRAPAH